MMTRVALIALLILVTLLFFFSPSLPFGADLDMRTETHTHTQRRVCTYARTICLQARVCRTDYADAIDDASTRSPTHTHTHTSYVRRATVQFGALSFPFS